MKVVLVCVCVSGCQLLCVCVWVCVGVLVCWSLCVCLGWGDGLDESGFGMKVVWMKVVWDESGFG